MSFLFAVFVWLTAPEHWVGSDGIPNRIGEHRLRAALGTDARPVETSSHRWNLPRFVCGRDWNSPDAFGRLLDEAL